MNPQILGQLAALGTATCWTVTSLSFEAAGKRVGSLQVNLIRLVIAFLVFSLLLTIRNGQPLPLDAGAHVWIWLSLSGLVGFVMGDLFLFQAFVDVGARTAMLVYSSVPPMTALIGWVVLGERLTPLQFVAMAATVGGIVLVTTAVHAAPPRSAAPAQAPAEVIDTGVRARRAAVSRPHTAVVRPHRLRGIWFALLGALGQALGLVLGRYGAPEYDAFAATQIRVLTGMVGFAVVFSVLRRWPRIFAAVRDGRAMRHVARGAFFGPFLGVSLGLFAAQRAGTGVAATIIATVPVLLIPVTVIGFGERITPRELAGALLAVGGVALLFLG